MQIAHKAAGRTWMLFPRQNAQTHGV